MAKIDIFAEQDNGMVDSLEGQKILIYGSSSCGKTYQTTRLPKSMLLMTESGGNARTTKKFPINTWDNFTDIVSQLLKDVDKSRQMYDVVIIDTVEELVALVEDKVARMYGVQDISAVQSSSPDAPNGFLFARNLFKKQINALTKNSFCVIFIAHETEIDDYLDPYTGKETKKIIPFGANKEKSSAAFVKNICDFVINVRSRGVDPETGRTLYSMAVCTETEHIFARSRYTQMQPIIEEFTAESLTEAILTAIRKEAEAEGAGLISFKRKDDENYSKEDYFDLIKPYMVKIFEIDPAFVGNIVENNLGAGKKLTDATNNQLLELSKIYEEFVQYCADRQIVV